MSQSVERLHFRIGISGTYWLKKPVYSVLVNSTEYVRATVSGASEEIEYVEFDCELNEGAHVLQIRLENKSDRDTVVDLNNVITQDMLLNIKSIEVDGIDLGNIIWNKSYFEGDEPDRPRLDNCVNLGWNGSYILQFTSPFYLWLLENI